MLVTYWKCLHGFVGESRLDGCIGRHQAHGTLSTSSATLGPGTRKGELLSRCSLLTWWWLCLCRRRESLEFGAKFLAGFGVSAATVAGNHDLEGEDFETDEANLQAWREVRSSGLTCGLACGVVAEERWW